ncbi:MAG: hypothetical protein ACJ72T_00115, partial [Nitrososphaeraceae archaeon]
GTARDATLHHNQPTAKEAVTGWLEYIYMPLIKIKNIFLTIVVDYIDVAVLYLCLVGCICCFGSCYLHQNRFPGRNLCCIGGIVFLVSAIAVLVDAVAAAALSLLDNHVAHWYLDLMVSFCQFLGSHTYCQM